MSIFCDSVCAKNFGIGKDFKYDVLSDYMWIEKKKRF